MKNKRGLNFDKLISIFSNFPSSFYNLLRDFPVSKYTVYSKSKREYNSMIITTDDYYNNFQHTS